MFSLHFDLVRERSMPDALSITSPNRGRLRFLSFVEHKTTKGFLLLNIDENKCLLVSQAKRIQRCHRIPRGHMNLIGFLRGFYSLRSPSLQVCG